MPAGSFPNKETINSSKLWSSNAGEVSGNFRLCTNCEERSNNSDARQTPSGPSSALKATRGINPKPTIKEHVAATIGGRTPGNDWTPIVSWSKLEAV